MVQVKKHFFDATDFVSPYLLNSPYVTDKIMDFIFYLNQSEDLNELNKMQKEAINISLAKIDSNLDLKKNIEESILEQYASEQNEEMVNFMFSNHYDKLPLTLQDEALRKYVLSEIKTAVGKKAPNITWKENGLVKSLYDLEESDYYIVVFYSSGCPHCQIEIPIFYDFIKDVSNIKVIAIGLEDEKSAWEEMAGGYDKFINILDLDKWESKRVQDFGIVNIPNYFVLDKEKVIIAKPEDIEELKNYFP
jgi:thiol-disulfide isomerase/thioredoxin